MSEGNLEAPTRHPIDWRNPEFYDEGALFAEMGRVFDICHGCRRCVSLCGAFPTLFDLVDESKTMEVDGVAKADYWKVVDQCYLCDVCYMTKCPYVPPHPWNVDFPHLMLRGKAQKFEAGRTTFRDRLLTGTDRLGKLATIPVVVQMVNKANSTPVVRRMMDRTLGIAAEAALPPYAATPFLDKPPASLRWPVRDGPRTPGKVAIFATCYVNYNEPGIGRDLAKLLEHNEVPFDVVQGEVCCGMPKLELGDLASVETLKDVNIALLAPLARAGHAIVSPVPSCTLMFKQEMPLLFPEDADVRAVAEADRFAGHAAIHPRRARRVEEGRLDVLVRRARAEPRDRAVELLDRRDRRKRHVSRRLVREREDERVVRRRAKLRRGDDGAIVETNAERASAARL